MSDGPMSETATTAWHKERIDPVQFLRARNVDVPWIVFDPPVVKGIHPRAIFRREQQRHDGTALFTEEILRKLLAPFVHGVPFDKREPPEEHLGESLIYHLGWLRLASTYPPDGVEMAAGRYPGIRERASINYWCEWVRMS